MKKVLFVMDIQEDMTGTTASKGPFPITEHQKLIDHINQQIQRYEKNGDDVVYIVVALPDNFFFRKLAGIAIKGTPGCEIDARIKRVSQYYFEKSKASAFSNKDLVHFVKEKGVTHVEITGIDAAQCCAATAADAVKLGLSATIIQSATATTVHHKLEKVNQKLVKMGVKFI